MSGTELIMGMEEVVQHIRELEAERDNYKRKWENVKNVSAGKQRKIDKLKYDLYELNDIAAERGSHNEALEEERVRLEFQNKQLQQEKKEWIEYADEERKILTKVIDGMKQEIKKLQEEKSAMKEALAEKFYKHYEEMDYNKLNVARTIGPDLGRMVDHLMAENKRLQGEQLTEENAIRYVYENTDEYDDWVKGSTAYKQLQEENKKLKKEHIQSIMKTKSIATELYREVKYSLGYGEFDEPDRKVMYDDIKKLKEESKVDKQFQEEVVQENKKLEEELEEKDAHWNDFLNGAFGDELYPLTPSPEPDEFVKKVKEMEEELLYYRFYTYTLDKDGDCDLTKEDVDKFTEDEGQRKILYERIGYEEEDVVFLYPNDEGSIQDPEHPEDNYSFGNNSKSKIGDNYTMKRILKNGSIKDCFAAYAYCMFVKGGKLYYRGRSSSGPAHVRTIKGEKTTMEFPY